MGIELDKIRNPDLRRKILELDRIQNPTSGGVGAVASAIPEQAALRSALVYGVQKPAGSAPGMAYRVTLVSIRKRLLDSHDNLPYAMKPLVDAIADSLNLKDDDRRITWQYNQIQSRGEPGVLVHIEAYEYSGTL